MSVVVLALGVFTLLMPVCGAEVIVRHEYQSVLTSNSIVRNIPFQLEIHGKFEVIKSLILTRSCKNSACRGHHMI